MLNKKIVEDFFIEGYNKNNYDFVMRHVSKDYIDHSPANAVGNMGAVDILKIVNLSFPDMKVTVLDIFCENEMVATRVKYECTHVNEYMGIKPTGKKLVWEALENFKIINGVIIESWGYWPDANILYQLKDRSTSIGKRVN